MALEVTIEIPQAFIDVVKSTQVWKEEAAGTPWSDLALKRFFKEYLAVTGIIKVSIYESNFREWVSDHEDILYDEIYESSLTNR